MKGKNNFMSTNAANFYHPVGEHGGVINMNNKLPSENSLSGFLDGNMKSNEHQPLMKGKPMSAVMGRINDVIVPPLNLDRGEIE